MNLKEKLIDYSKSIHIDRIGFCSARSFNEIKEHLKETKRKGYLSGFEEKDIDKRINPQLTMLNAKSFIVIAIKYDLQYLTKYDSNDIRQERNLKGKISIGMIGKDYHLTVKEKLKVLGEYYQEKTGGNYKIFVDNGPLIDREIAKRAGLGYQGKNCSIISLELGSLFYIGYLLVDTFIEPDKVNDKDICGACNTCIISCPTGAIKGYSINAQRCISYLTQTKDHIENKLRQKMGMSIYGCDICQRVCPHNEKFYENIKEGIDDDNDVSIEELLKLSNRQFKEKYGKTAIGWRGNKVIQRNAIIALGNSKNKKALEILRKTLNNEKALLREYSIWAIATLGFEEGVEILNERLEIENDEILRELINCAIKTMKQRILGNNNIKL